MASEQWILDLEKKLQLPQNPLDQPRLKSIYRVPKVLTDVNRQAYEPKLASFGPYHHDCIHLLCMEKHKERALMQFLRRISLASKTPKDVLVAMREVEPRLIASYSCLQAEDDYEEFVERGRFHPHDWLKDKDEFVRLMIVDSCFALEIMLADKRSVAGEQSEYDSDDPIFGALRKNHFISDLRRDMLLLENQLPLLALITLAAIDGSGIEDLNFLIKAFYNINSASREDGIIDKGGKVLVEESFHILDFYKKALTFEGDYQPIEEEILFATKLKNAGVSFCNSKSKSFRDISFNNGILYLPQLKIDDMTEPLLLNLMGFERLHKNAGNAVIAYVFFMNDLIHTADDVSLLKTKKIIVGSRDETIVNIFNTIVKEVKLEVSTNNVRVNVKGKLNTYCKNRFCRWRAYLLEKYIKTT